LHLEVFIVDLVDTIGQVEGLHLYITPVELKTSLSFMLIYIISKITLEYQSPFVRKLLPSRVGWTQLLSLLQKKLI
jgi:hypothetical protein